MKTDFGSFLVAGPVVGLALLFGCSAPPAQDTRTGAPAMSPAERGEFLVQVGACNDCHTPFHMGPQGPEPDMTRMLSGHPQDLVMPPPPDPGDSPWNWGGAATNTAFFGPWGVTYAINLTPDTTSGTGAWTEEMFVQSIRTGKHWGSGRQIMPPMPWSWYAVYPEEDLRAIYAYLRTVPAIHNEVPPYQPPQ
jgi:hypothetical protein